MNEKGRGAKPKDWVEWRGLSDGPWPAVFVNGDLELAEAEWLAANNLGVYSMSTVALMHTRRQHGLLVSPFAEDFRRHVVLSHLEMSLDVGGRTHSLSTHQFPNMAPTLGYRALESFAQDPLPRWVYRFNEGTIERTVSLVHDRQAVVIAFSWSGKKSARLTLRPLMPMRPSEELCHEHGGMLQKVSLRAGEVEVQPAVHLPPVIFRHSGVFMGFPDWWRKFEYLDDRARYEEFQEDMWSPGIFEFTMQPRETRYLVVGVGTCPDGNPADLVMDAALRRLNSDPLYSPEGGPPSEGRTSSEARLSSDARLSASQIDTHLFDKTAWLEDKEDKNSGGSGGIRTEFEEIEGDSSLISPEIRALWVAAESFVFGDGAAIVAGYPWLDVWSRDTLLSLPGIYLARGQDERARRSIRHLLRNMDDGFLVARTTCEVAERRPCVDASLWLFSVGSAVMDRSRDHLQFCDELYLSQVAIFRRICEEKKQFAWLTSDGLLANGADFALTWMEASYGGRFYTPRKGLAIEFQALWIRACEVISAEATLRGETALALDAEERRRQAMESFERTFWCHETNYPFDCISESPSAVDAGADPDIRPNALIALCVAPHLFEPWQVDEILCKVEERLLTPRGVRTLDPASHRFVGHAGQTIEEGAIASHQGAAWPHLLLFYVRAKLRQSPESALKLHELIVAALQDVRALGYVGQSADGDYPYRAWGIPASAMATGMLLEALVGDLGGAIQSARGH